MAEAVAARLLKVQECGAGLPDVAVAPASLRHDKRLAADVRFRTDNLRPPLGTKRLAGRCDARRLVAIPHTCDKEPGGKRRCQGPLVAAPFQCCGGTLTALYAERETGSAHEAVPPPIWPLCRCVRNLPTAFTRSHFLFRSACRRLGTWFRN